MIRSMTGFGEAERSTPAGRLRAELKTVNHRFLNTSFRTPSGFDRWEARIHAWLREHLSRGHVSLSLTLETEEEAEGDEPLLEVDLARARRYRDLLHGLAAELDMPGTLELSHVLRFDDVFHRPDPGREAPEVDEALLREVLDEAARQVVALREAEGLRLREDMEGRLEAISDALDRVEAGAPERLVRERDRLRDQVRELSGQEDVDEDRLAREIAYLAEKWDIHEEIVRFRSHVELFREALEADAAEPVGKRLSFLVQEMHREANTLGAKANDPGISQASVALKEEVERLREQVENVE